YTVLYLVEREDARLYRQLAELVTEHGVIVPALRTRIERVDERRPADAECLADLVHHLHRVRGVHGGDVAALGMPGREHARGVLLPRGVDEPMHGAGRAEGGVRPVWGRARELDVGVGVRLVVVHQDEAVVVLVGQRGRDTVQPHVRAAAVAAERDDVDGFALHL